MSDVGMHTHKPGGRQSRSPNHNSTKAKSYGNGLRKIRNRAKALSNAVGYDSREAPRMPRKAE